MAEFISDEAHNIMTLQRHVFYGLFLFFLLGFEWTDLNQAAEAQVPTPPIYTAFDIRNLYWSPDSSTLVFHDIRGSSYGAVLAEGEYFAYDVSSGNLTSSSVWPLQPILTAQELETYAPIRSPDDYMPSSDMPDVIDEFMFLSPNERFMVYVAGTDPRERRFAIADRTSIRAKTFDRLAGNTSQTDKFFTLWSDDSKSVVIGDSPLLDTDGFVRYFYITNYADNVQAATIEEITLNIIVNERRYGGGYIQDISADGQTLLMTPTDENVDGSDLLEDLRLAAYRIGETPPTLDAFENALLPSRRLHPSPSIFDPRDERYILALRDDGLQRYNTIANTWEMITADITSPDSGRALFSPDGRYLAIQSDRPTGSLQDIYVIDLSEVYEPPVQLDPYPTHTPVP